MKRSAALVSILIALAAMPLPPAGAGTIEVKVQLPIRPKLSLTGHEKVVLAPFLVGAKSIDEKKDLKIDVDREFREYLLKQLHRKTKLTVQPLPDPKLRLPSADFSRMKGDAEFWKSVAARSGADIVISGAVDFDVQDRTGYKKEEYTSPIDGRTYYRQVLVEETGYAFDIALIVIDGRTGGILLDESFKDFQTKEGRRRDVLAGLFENLFSLESKILGIFVSRKSEAKRFIFEN